MNLSTNIVVLGPNKISIAWAKHSLNHITTGMSLGKYSWPKLLTDLDDRVRRYAMPGAKVLIYHHEFGYLGHVFKTGESLWQVKDIRRDVAGLLLPEKLVN